MCPIVFQRTTCSLRLAHQECASIYAYLCTTVHVTCTNVDVLIAYSIIFKPITCSTSVPEQYLSAHSGIICLLLSMYCNIFHRFSAYYMFIETSAPRVIQNNAYLRTTASYTNDGRSKCLHLWYNAFGNGKGTLRIYTGTANAANKNQIREIPSKFSHTLKTRYSRTCYLGAEKKQKYGFSLLISLENKFLHYWTLHPQVGFLKNN